MKCMQDTNIRRIYKALCANPTAGFFFLPWWESNSRADDHKPAHEFIELYPWDNNLGLEETLRTPAERRRDKKANVSFHILVCRCKMSSRWVCFSIVNLFEFKFNETDLNELLQTALGNKLLPEDFPVHIGHGAPP